MATKKRGLGRGLDALLGGAGAPVKKAETAVPEKNTSTTDGDLRMLGVDLMKRGRYQPRVDMHTESLEELADSIREQGVVQPIVVRPVADNQYEIIAGERRWRAAQLAGLQEVPVVIRRVDDRAAIAMALIENIQRENLNPMEEARALHRLMEEFEMTQQQAAEAVGRSRSGVANLLRLLDLNEEVKVMLEKGLLEMGHARAILALKGLQQTEVANKVSRLGLSVREAEQLVRQYTDPPKKTTRAEVKIDPNLRRLQEDLSEKLGARVELQHKPNGKGKLVITYNSNDELDGILEHIR